MLCKSICLLRSVICIHTACITHVAAPNVNKSIQKAIYNARSTTEISTICQQKQNEIYHSSIYGKAMKQCSTRGAQNNSRHNQTVDDIVKIMDVMLRQNIMTDVIEFNLFFDLMVQYDKPLLCRTYFKLMIEKHKLSPNVIIFCTLIKSTRAQCKYKLAEEYWNAMRNTYKITPNSIVCTEMISVYSVCHKPHDAINIFKKYENLADQQMMSALLSAFARVGDVKQMENILEMMQEQGVAYDASVYADIMNRHLNAQSPIKCIEICDDLMAKKQIKLNRTVLGLKGLALCQLLEQYDDAWDRSKEDIYDEINDLFDNTFPDYCIQCEFEEYELLLRANILFYRDRDRMKMVQMMEQIVHEKLNVFIKTNVIDLHRFSPLAARFVLAYVIGFKCSETVSIIVGKGNHGKGESNKKQNLGKLVISELLAYDPPIRCHVEPTNKGRLLIDKEQLMPYVVNENNYATKWLMT
eukprot:21308_1